MSFTPQRRSRRSSGSGSPGILGIIFAILLLVAAMGFVIQFLQSPPGLVFVIVVIAAVVAFVVWRNHRRNQQRLKWLMYQQQKAAWDQQQQRILWQQQQEAARQQYARQEWERQERERQERERIAQLKSLGDILVLTPKEFEQLTGKVMLRNGLHNIQHTGGSGDLGADLIGYDMLENQVVIQCKRYAPGNSIGSPEIQKFIGMMSVHHRAQRGIFVTTSIFTQPAINLAAQYDILLIDGAKMVQLVKKMSTV